MSVHLFHVRFHVPVDLFSENILTSCVIVMSQVATWLGQIGQATLTSYRDMGVNLSSARDFLDIHERLEEDLRVSIQMDMSV